MSNARVKVTLINWFQITKMSLVEQFSSSHDEVDFIALTSQCLLGIWHAIVVFRAVSLAELSPRWAGFVMFAQGDGVASTATRTCLSVSGNLFLLFFLQLCHLHCLYVRPRATKNSSDLQHARRPSTQCHRALWTTWTMGTLTIRRLADF